MYRAIKSYVTRSGRISKRQQQGLELWLKEFELKQTGSPWCFNMEFAREADTIVEIGFGMGSSLLHMARQNPEHNYIGIEVHKAGIGSLAADLQDEQLTNVRIVAHDAVEIFKTHIKNNSLAGVQIFFPDPWHKKRHQKRRLIQSPFVGLLVEKIKTNGFIHCATDWEEYAVHMLEVLSTAEGLHHIKNPDDFSPKSFYRPHTKFERRAERLGHRVWDLIFIKK